jgi:hypothetical protein
MKGRGTDRLPTSDRIKQGVERILNRDSQQQDQAMIMGQRGVKRGNNRRWMTMDFSSKSIKGGDDPAQVSEGRAILSWQREAEALP